MNISSLRRTSIDTEAHWYHRTGERCVEVVGKNSERRKPTLKDAKELGLLPGVTGICKIYPGSINWWSQDIMTAGEVGTRRHEIAEAFHHSGNLIAESSHLEFINPYREWFSKAVSYSSAIEKVVFSLEHGYAGTMDLFCTLARVGAPTAVVDLKNRKNLATYDTDAMQLAAYRRAIGADVGISVILGTEKPGILVKEWSAQEDADAFCKFHLCLSLWKKANAYYPESWKPKEE